MPLPGGSGITRINEADDISFSNLSEGDVITWDGTFNSWENAQANGPGPSLATIPSGSTITVDQEKSGGTFPVRPTARTDVTVVWQGWTDPGNAALDGDSWRVVPAP